jgi:4-oxalocrotonate tautomerase
MPVLHLQVVPLLNPADYANLARRLTEVTARVLHKDAACTLVVIDDLPAARLHVGGAACTQPVAHLRITVSAGSNSAAEKAAFVAQAFDCLRESLAAHGRLLETSYVVVQDMPRSDWGYGGLTQQARLEAVRAADALHHAAIEAEAVGGLSRATHAQAPAPPPALPTGETARRAQWLASAWR